MEHDILLAIFRIFWRIEQWQNRKFETKSLMLVCKCESKQEWKKILLWFNAVVLNYLHFRERCLRIVLESVAFFTR